MSDHSPAHLAADSLLPPDPRCPACGGARDLRAVMPVQSDPAVAFVRCPRCEVLSASPMPTPGYLEAFYRDSFARSYVGRAEGEGPGLGRHVARRAAPPTRGGLVRVLDFGGNVGALGLEVARQFLRRGVADRVALHVVDFVAPLASNDPRIVVTSSPKLDPAATFDLVVASAVLEHIPDLSTTLRSLAAAVAPGGRFYVRAPWIRPLRRLLPRYETCFPAHVHDFPAAFWARLPTALDLPLRVLDAGPSPVDTTLRAAPVVTLAAMALKAPARLERRLRRSPDATPWWPLVGGWEVIYGSTA